MPSSGHSPRTAFGPEQESMATPDSGRSVLVACVATAGFGVAHQRLVRAAVAVVGQCLH